MTATSDPSGTPVWIPSPPGPLFGWWHAPPDGTARGAVLVCPALGREHVSSYRTLRALAERLARSGIAALRFDYPGTGDSGDGPGDEGCVAAWQAGVTAAADWLVGRGAPRLAFAGMRMGALLAAGEAARRHDVEALVLWDPCLSGRHYLREQRALRLVTLPDHPMGDGPGVETPGFVYGPATAADVGRLDARQHRPAFPARTVLLSRSEEAREEFAGPAGWAGDWIEAADQSRLLECSSVLSVEPTASVDRIVQWLGAALDGDATALEAPDTTAAAVVSAAGSGDEVVEEARSVGHACLFAMHTSAPARLDRRLPPVVFFNVAEEPHIGPGRLWVDLARKLAVVGFEVLRLDFNGVGDSPPRPGRLEFPTGTAPFLTDKALMPNDEAEAERLFPNPSFDQGNLDDVADLAAAAGRPAVLVGLCSGGYHAVEMGAALPAAGVVALNPLFDFMPPEMRAGLPMDPRRRSSTPRREWANTVKDRRIGAFARRIMPDVGWRLIDLLRLQPSPVTALLPLADTSVPALIVCNQHDAEPFLERGAQVLRRLRSRPHFSFTVVPELDHALLVWAERRRAGALIESFVVDTFSGRGVAAAAATPPLAARS